MFSQQILGLEIKHWLVLLSALISISGASFYIRDTLKGRVKPNKVSWSMWALAPIVATCAAMSAGADPWATVRIFLSGFMPLLIVLVSFVSRQSYWKISIFDSICGVLSLAALVLWVVNDQPLAAIWLALIGDAFACLPTIIKAYKFPESENRITYIMSFISGVVVIPSIPIWNVQNSAFTIYLLVANFLILIPLVLKRDSRI